jgi:hypothetical protein
VVGLDTTVNAGVIPGLQTILLGREWIQSVNLLSGFGNQSYYIPVPIAVEAAYEKVPNIVDSGVEAKDSQKFEMATSNEIGEEYDDDEYGNVDDDDNGSSDSELSSDEPTSDDRPLFDRELSTGELSSHRQNSLDDDPSGDEHSIGGDLSSDSEVLSGEELTLEEHALTPSDEDDKVYRDDEDYEAYSAKEYEECDECQECEGQGKEEHPKANSQDFMKPHKHLEHFAEAERVKEDCDIKRPKPEQNLHRKDPLDRNDTSIGDPAFDVDFQQSEPREERVSKATILEPANNCHPRHSPIHIDHYGGQDRTPRRAGLPEERSCEFIAPVR